jgi:inosose dehydratase
MSNAKLAYAIWPWGLSEKAQMVQAIQDIKAVGYRYFESVCTALDVFKGNAAEFKAITDEHQVHAVSFYFYQRGDIEKDVAQVQNALDFLAACNVQRMSIQATGKKGGHATPEELKTVLAYLGRIGKLCKPYGIVPCVHPHSNTMIMYENEVDFVLQNTDPELIAFGPDSAHLTVGLCDPVAIYKRYAKRIKFTHLKDVKKKQQAQVDNAKQGFEVYSSFLELGEGEVDVRGCVKALEAVGYDGYLTVELDSSRFGNKQSAEMNMKYMRALGYK